MSILDSLVAKATEWVPIPDGRQGEVKDLAKTHPISINYQGGHMHARLDSLPASCEHSGDRREVDSGVVCVDCGEILARPAQAAPLPSEDAPWNKWLHMGNSRPPIERTVVEARPERSGWAAEAREEALRRSTSAPASATSSSGAKRTRLADTKPSSSDSTTTAPAASPSQSQTSSAASVSTSPSSSSTPATPGEPSSDARFPIEWDGKKRLTFGEALPCYRCHGRLRPERWTKERKDKRTKKVIPPQLIPADEYSRDPERSSDDERCHRCNGHGLIPNVGPQPQDTEVMDIDVNLRREQEAARRAKYAPSTGQRSMEDDPDLGAAHVRAKPPRRSKPRMGSGRSARLLRPIPDPLAGPAQPQEGVGGGEALLPDAGPG